MFNSQKKIYGILYHYFTANPDETGDFYEGDIVLPESLSKVVTNNPSRKWPNGVLPYVFEGSFSK